MNLAQIEAKTHTTTTTASDYIIPGADKSLAYLQVTNSTVQPSGETSTVVEVINAVKDKNLKVLKKCQPKFVNESFFEYIKTNNPFHTYEYHQMSDEEILEGNISEKNLVWFYDSGHMLFDSNAIPYTLPHRFDYIGTPFNNEYCNLPELLKYLKNHPWVLNKEELKIENIPYYNSQEGRDKCISDINIRPDQETYAKIYELVKIRELFGKRINDEFFSCRVPEQISSYLYLFNQEKHNDWLGIAPFLKKKAKDDSHGTFEVTL
jgi:hypothetical protein